MNTSPILLVVFDAPLSLVQSSVLKHNNRSDFSRLAVIHVLLYVPVEAGQLVDDFLKGKLVNTRKATYQHHFVVVTFVEDLQLVVLKQFDVRLALVVVCHTETEVKRSLSDLPLLSLVLLLDVLHLAWHLAVSAQVFFVGIATGSHA